MQPFITGEPGNAPAWYLRMASAAVMVPSRLTPTFTLMEGPQDKVVLFLRVEDVEAEVRIPERHPGIAALAYLGGHTLGHLLDVERSATAEALRRAGRPNATLTLPRVGARELGELFMLMQIATVYAGALYDVDPLDQPGVELGKQLTYGLLGREGAERPDMLEADEAWIL